MGILDAAIGQIRNYMSRRCPGQPGKNSFTMVRVVHGLSAVKKTSFWVRIQALSWEIPVRNPCP